MSNDKPVYVVQHNHFDPTWRRCWDRTFDFRGKRYRSYADVEERVIDLWLENAKKGLGFSEGQSVVFRKYLERNPERYEEMRDLVERGIIDLTIAGETVSDTNMPSGETLLRNLILGQLYFEDTFDVISHVGWLEDAFGQSAQIPQMFRGIECKLALKLCYKRVPGEYWKGLDGSVIFVGDAPLVHGAGHCIKTGPCFECNGVGCEACSHTGFAVQGDLPEELINRVLDFDYSAADPCGMFLAGGEEAVPNLQLPELVEQAKIRTGTNFQFGGFKEVAEHMADIINKVDDPNVTVSSEIEGNPSMTGCYVSRIKIKQEMRRIENMVNTAERWAAVAHLMGAEYPIGCLTQAWRTVVFIGFHDALTCSHIDQAYFELLDMLADAEHEASHVLEDSLDFIDQKIESDPDNEYLMLYNSESWDRSEPVTVILTGISGCPAVKDASGNDIDVLDISAEGENVSVTFLSPQIPALGYSAVEIIPDVRPLDHGDINAGPGEVENEFFKVKVSSKGIESIIDKRTNQEILDTSKYLANELILEEDKGHPWGATQNASFEEGLAQYTTGVKIRKADNTSEIMLTGQYKGSDENTQILSWRQSVKIYKGVDRIDFNTKIDWDTAHRRIRVAFPTNIKTDEATYSIPYGALKRSKYEPDPNPPFNNGDWPVVNWVDVYDEKENQGVALINTGTPSHKVLDGVIFMSVLRSPADPWYLNEPEYYECPDFDGARDTGRHEFNYSLIPHAGDYNAASIEKRGREINNPLVIRQLAYAGEGELGLTHSFMKFDATDNVIITAIKKAERDDSLIVRLVETSGKPGEASISIDGAGDSISTVNFIERHPEPVSGKIKLAPFKIVTVELSE